jgi:S-DNA-T family DNA segregation ATPase FtsK/SpoIIIE
MGKNTYKSNTFKKSKEKRSRISFSPGFLKDKRFYLTIGIFLLTAAFFFMTAFVSYLFTGKADQSVVEAFNTTDIRESGFEIGNWFGLLGALSSHYFIYKWFGLASFFMPPFLFLLGTYVLFKKQLVSIRRSFQFILFSTFWLSTLLGYITLDESNPVVFSYITGGIGFEIATILHGLMGWGTYIFLIFLLIVFVIYFFNITSIMGLEKSFSFAPSTNDAISSKQENEDVFVDQSGEAGNDSEIVDAAENETESWVVGEKKKIKDNKEEDLELAIENEDNIFQ